MKINPDKEYRDQVIADIKANDGYCPCELIRTPETKCRCLNMRKNGICKCGLYVEDDYDGIED